MSRSPDRMNIDDDIRRRGRGYNTNNSRRDSEMDLDKTPVRSIEGWIVIVRGIHEEADEESLNDRFMEYGTIKNIHLNLDRRTGYVKGYALIEYEARKEAEAAIEQANDTEYLGLPIKVDYAFVRGPEIIKEERDSRRRQRSPSPRRN